MWRKVKEVENRKWRCRQPLGFMHWMFEHGAQFLKMCFLCFIPPSCSFRNSLLDKSAEHRIFFVFNLVGFAGLPHGRKNRKQSLFFQQESCVASYHSQIDKSHPACLQKHSQMHKKTPIPDRVLCFVSEFHHGRATGRDTSAATLTFVLYFAWGFFSGVDLAHFILPSCGHCNLSCIHPVFQLRAVCLQTKTQLT